jgi:quercetin dioxygenase-like cupin family protein
MSLIGKRIIFTGASLCVGLVVSNIAWSHGGAAKERARIVLSRQLPRFDGARLKVRLVEVNYGPGEASPAHSHPCAVVGYVVEGTLRTQVKGEPEMTYKPGESFYEAPNGSVFSASSAAVLLALYPLRTPGGSQDTPSSKRF